MNPMATHGAFSWFSYRSNNQEKAQNFYQSVLDWKIAPREMADGITYGMVMIDDEPVAGIDANSDHLPGWLCYITVDDVDARFRAAEAAGAEGLQVPTDVPGVGRIAILQDPFGAQVGLVTYESMMK